MGDGSLTQNCAPSKVPFPNSVTVTLDWTLGKLRHAGVPAGGENDRRWIDVAGADDAYTVLRREQFRAHEKG